MSHESPTEFVYIKDEKHRGELWAEATRYSDGFPGVCVGQGRFGVMFDTDYLVFTVRPEDVPLAEKRSAWRVRPLTTRQWHKLRVDAALAKHPERYRTRAMRERIRRDPWEEIEQRIDDVYRCFHGDWVEQPKRRRETTICLETVCAWCNNAIWHTDTAGDMGAETELGQLVTDHETWNIENEGWRRTSDGLVCPNHRIDGS